MVLEGGEGVGKSTHAENLAIRSGSRLTRETGGTAIGLRLREILHDTGIDNLDGTAELLIAGADRAQHIAEVVRPITEQGRSVVSDRNWFSTMAYQGFGRGLDLDEVITITKIATREFFQPNKVFVLIADENVVLERMKGRELDRFEIAGLDFHRRVHAGYLHMIEEFGGVFIDANPNLEEVRKAIWRKCGDLLLRREEE